MWDSDLDPCCVSYAMGDGGLGKRRVSMHVDWKASCRMQRAAALLHM